jgi:hypothetical protein
MSNVVRPAGVEWGMWYPVVESDYISDAQFAAGPKGRSQCRVQVRELLM